jgi:adenosylcobyric acid synthase
MLGEWISDPEHIESAIIAAKGLGMLPIEAMFAKEKITARVEATHIESGLWIAGYEIHCGRLTGSGATPMFHICTRQDKVASEDEGAVSEDRLVMGTSIHSLFDAPHFRRHFLNQIRQRKGLPLCAIGVVQDARALNDHAYDRFANILKDNFDLVILARLVSVEPDRLRA